MLDKDLWELEDDEKILKDSVLVSNFVKSDSVNHPNHYQILEGVEAIDVIKSILGPGFSDYCYGNVLKYILRAKKKNGLEDLKKAKVYLDWVIDEIESGDD